MVDWALPVGGGHSGALDDSSHRGCVNQLDIILGRLGKRLTRHLCRDSDALHDWDGCGRDGCRPRLASRHRDYRHGCGLWPLHVDCLSSLHSGRHGNRRELAGHICLELIALREPVRYLGKEVAVRNGRPQASARARTHAAAPLTHPRGVVPHLHRVHGCQRAVDSPPWGKERAHREEQRGRPK
eukprot:scaffold35779_cov36-Tisochrysis_lutea.AAC.4